jgi:hypothetical protein
MLAYMTFPAQHRAKLHSTNPIEIGIRCEPRWPRLRPDHESFGRAADSRRPNGLRRPYQAARSIQVGSQFHGSRAARSLIL